MAKELVISAPAHERRVAILEEGQLVEIYIEREKEFALVGSIYKGRVTRVLPGMQSAFVDIGLDGDAFLYVSDVFENLEDYEPAGTHAETPVPPMGTSALGEGEPGPGVSSESAPEEAASSEAPLDAQPGAPPEIHGQPQQNAGTAEAQPQQNFQPRNDRPERGNESRGNRGGSDYGSNRGGDRGGRGGGGRWGGRGGRNLSGGGRGPDRGRNLPPSKYASPQGGQDQRGPGYRGGDQRGFEPRRPDAPRYSPPAEGGDDSILLPGESLAKYRGKTPATMLPPDEAVTPTIEPRVESAEAATQPGETAGGAQRSVRGLPSWVLADANAEATHEETSAQTQPPAAQEIPAAGAEPPAAPASTRPDVDLTDEDITALASQLAEAKHEESQAEAEADSVSGGAEFEDEANAVETDESHAGEAPAFHDDAAADEAHDVAEDEAELAEEHAQAEAGPEPVGTGETKEAAVLEASSGEARPAEVTENLLPGETRSPHGFTGSDRPADARPREEYPRDSARIGGDPRSRFQRPRPSGRSDRGGRFVRRGDRGGRGDRSGPPPQRFERRPQGQSAPPRRPHLISEMLKAGQDVVIQIAKEPLGKKGARITSHVALPGRFLVYMPTVNHVGVSRKIESAENRSRLRRLVQEGMGSYPGGFIVRTAAGGATDDEIRTDIEFLGKTWNEIKQQSEQRKSPALLHRDLNLVERILRDYVNEDYTAIWTDSEEEYGKIVEFMSRFQPKLVNRVKLYTKETPIFEEFGIQHDLDKALRPKVWLKSGGYIVINHTEALVAIDVNTGKYVGRGSTRLEDTIVKTNLEAVKEIVRQIRLRDLGGIIVVDFIDMEERRNREKVLSALQQALDQDKAPSKALSFNEFGLVCITRKRTKQALERVLCQPCPYCTGSGMVKSIPTLCYEIQAEARKMAVDHDEPNLTVRVHPEIAKALKTREAMLIDELEQNSHKHVIIQSDATLHWEQYDIY